MMFTGAHIAAKIGGMSPVLVPGVQRWSARITVRELDGTTAEDGGFEGPDFGLKGCTVNMSLVIDIASGDLTTLEAGTVITNLKLYTDTDSATPVLTIPTAKVFECVPQGEVNGRFTYDVMAKSKGSFTLANP